MIRVEKINLCELQLPLKEPFQISSGEVSMRRVLVVKLIDGDGTVGWGESVAGEQPYYSPETIEGVWIAIRNFIGPRVLGRTFEHPRDVFPALSEDIRGNNMAKAAIEMASWELAATKLSTSLADLLGGSRSRIATGISIGIQQSPAMLVEKARASAAAGYQKIKIKIKPGADVDYVRSVRDALGPDVPLMVDANNAYSLDDIEHLQQLDDFDLMMIEQPLQWDDIVRHATLQAAMRTPICLDESITGPDRAEDMISLGAGRIINIKPGRVGGLAPAMAIHDICERHGIPVWCGGMLESGIGRAHNVALASLSNFSLPGDVSPSSRYWERDIVAPEWTMDSDGFVTVPRNKSGMGVDIDRDWVDELTVRSETFGL